MGTEHESLADAAVLQPLVCGMHKAISEITGLSALVYTALVPASHKRHCSVIKAGYVMQAKKESNYFGEGKYQEAVI